MAIFKNFIRGGQTQVHQIRMAKQIIWIALLLALLPGVGYFGWKNYQVIPKWAWNSYFDYRKAQFFTYIPGKDENSVLLVKDSYNNPSEIKIKDLLQNFRYQRVVKDVNRVFEINLFKAIKVSIGIILSLLIFWFLKGFRQTRKSFLRGAKFVRPRTLAWMIRKKLKASWLMIDKVPLIKDKETTHILLTGATGSGKTNCLYKFLPKIQKRGQKAIVIDLNGSLVSKYYRKGKDIILNPFDKRNAPWSPWADCLTTSHYEAFAKAMIPGGNFSGDKFWDSAAQTVLAAALEKQGQSKDLKVSSLCQTLMGDNLRDMASYFEDTHAANLINQDSEKTTGSILATLSTQIKALRYIEDTENPFSIRKFIEDEDRDGWIFLTAKPDQRETLTPLITAWFEIALNGLMSCDPDHNRRVWFIIDELPALQKVPSLDTALSEARKYGGCVLAGIQNIAQLTTIYGHHTAKTLLDNFATKIFFKSTDPDTAHWTSRVLGSSEEEETNENLSYGANTMRDGVNLSHHRRKRSLVMDDEIMNLKNLEAYIKLPESFPITKMKTKLETPESVTAAFVEVAPKAHKFIVKRVKEETSEKEEDDTMQTNQ